MAAKRANKRPAKESPDGKQLLVLELQEIHSAETQLARTLPRLTKAVESDHLRQMFEERLTEGEQIVADIETALEELEESPGRKKNIAAEGLINDAREHIQEIEPGPALDAVLIGAMQKTEHYCIAAWGTARALAEATSQATAARAMSRALKEGGKFDEQLTQLAEKEITPALLENEADDSTDTGDGRGRSGRDGNERRTST
jgi:ferritin-like metal-binding protein YciE